MTGAATIRALLDAGETVNMPGVFDALSARLAAEAGFPVLFVSGFAVSAARLGMPDYGYLTPTEMADVARAICASVDVPVIVDADTGYGNALSAQHTARGLAAAGASGIFLEDQEWPKRCGHMQGKRVVARGDWLAKLSAVRDLRDEGVDLFLVARTDARAAVCLDEAISRAVAAAELGVDAVFVEAPANTDEFARIAREVPGVVRVANMVEGGRTPLLTPTELHSLGCDLIVTPLTALFAATRAIRESLAELRRTGTMRETTWAGSAFSDFEGVVDLARHRALEQRYAAEAVDP